MRKTTTKHEQPQNLKKKLMSALAMFLVATTLMTTTSYAWFVLSTAPEVTGIATNVGANGSLEIALLNSETYEDMSLIRAGVGDSMVSNNPAANNAWGNLVDLGYVEYGLNSLLLLPARLNVKASGGKYMVDPGLLTVPTYGYDGRIVELTPNTVSAIYEDEAEAFTYSGGKQDYGVRAIGTSDALSVQGSALATAKSIINTNTNTAKNNATNVLRDNGDALFAIIMQYATDRNGFTDTHRDTLKAMINGLQKSLTDIETALRQGLVAYAASELVDEDAFTLVKDRLLDTEKDLGTILGELTEVGTVPAEFQSWVNKLATMQNNLNAANNACNDMTSGSYTWDEIKGVMEYIMNVDSLLINGETIETLNPTALLDASQIEMIMAPGSGIFADIADFTDNYTYNMQYMGKGVEIKTASAVSPKYLLALKAAAANLNPADGGEAASALPLTATYGYALDLAFRCNAAEPDLVLQTAGIQRVYSDSDSGSTQGGGSYMSFTSMDESFNQEQRLKLMDAIRVGFIDDQGEILGIAKPSVTLAETVNGELKAPLYLYSHTFVELDDTGLSLVMGERLLAENKITDLVQNTAKAVTSVVWLDGDIVDNTMVSATAAASLNGVMNLQFATSANLNPARDGMLLNFTGDKSQLEPIVLANQSIYEAGKGAYTTVSWTAFENAYLQAKAVNENDNAGVIEIRNASKNLVLAAAGLEAVSTDAISEKVTEIRDLMGTVEGEPARVVVDDGDNGYVAKDGYTQEEYDKKVAEINRVDYENKNMVDEGNGIYTTTYTDESWNALANALYDAEAVLQNPDATDEQINAALNALEQAEKGLTRQVYFKPYEYKGSLYYEAICDADNADSYGKWYDSGFNRVTSDVMILNLDAYAQEVTISEIGQNIYVASDAGYITPDISFMQQVYPELTGVEVKGVKWDEIDTTLFTEVIGDGHISQLNQLLSIVGGNALTVDTAAAEEMIANAEDSENWATAAEAEATISNLNDAVVEALEKKAEAENEGNMTSEQRILLTSAVNSAKAVAGYDEKAELKAAAEAAEALLTSETVVTADDAAAKLETLNAQLKAAGATEITVGNTLITKLPQGFGADDIVYDCEFPGIRLELTGKSGTAKLGAQILTKDGVVMKVSKDITVYDKIAVDEETAKNAINFENQMASLDAGASANVTAKLNYTGNKTEAEQLLETAASYTWASENTEVITVSNANAETCTLEAVGAGTAKITVSIETLQGNVYVAEFIVAVTAAP